MPRSAFSTNWFLSSPTLTASPWQRLPSSSAATAPHALSTLASVKCVGARPS
uniref:Uncharacterized protein n=1 Tax=Arundo donax TaxID=35708 RepID=A0A0A8YAE3_ARUDO